MLGGISLIIFLIATKLKINKIIQIILSILAVSAWGFSGTFLFTENELELGIFSCGAIFLIFWVTLKLFSKIKKTR